MSNLSEGFVFSQGSLQDYQDCARRFRLRYLDRLAWPAVAAEPADEYELQAAEGEAFHRLVHQHIVGLNAQRLTEMVKRQATDTDDAVESLPEWWDHYLNDGPKALPPNQYAEIGLSAPLGGYRLVAQYDLIALEPGQRAVIVDWKTSHRRTMGATLAGRMQTRVYRYLLARAGHVLNDGRPIQPKQIEMIYWFANFPDEPERLRYNTELYQADEVLFNQLVAEIEREEREGFPLTEDVTRCRFCAYRSLCQRGVEAGDVEALNDPEDAEESAEVLPAFDFDQIAEIVF